MLVGREIRTTRWVFRYKPVHERGVLPQLDERIVAEGAANAAGSVIAAVVLEAWALEIAAGKITDWEPGKCGDQLAARVSFPGGFGHTDVARDGSTHEDLAREQVGSIKQRLGLP